MRGRQGRVLETLRRVQGFLDGHDEQLHEVNASGARRALDSHIVQYTAHTLDQNAGEMNALGETERIRVLRSTLREKHMRPIAAIARATLRTMPEFGALQVPRRRTTSSRLVAAAGSMAEAAAVHTEVFVEGGMPPDFVAQLLGAAREIESAIDDRAASRGRRVGATTGLGAAETRARQILRVLDALVVPALGKHENLVTEWDSLRRVDEKPGPVRRGGEAAPATDGSSKRVTKARTKRQRKSAAAADASAASSVDTPTASSADAPADTVTDSSVVAAAPPTADAAPADLSVALPPAVASPGSTEAATPPALHLI